MTTASQPQESELIQDLKHARVIEVGDWANRATLDIIGVAGMGHDFNAIQDPNNELNTIYRTLFVGGGQNSFLGLLTLLIPFWMVRALPVKRNADILGGSRRIRQVCRQLVEKKRNDMQHKEKQIGVDILSVAFESGGFSEENLVDQLMTFLAAGHETTATALTWAICQLCQNKEIQSRLREEIRQNLPSVDDAETSVNAQIVDRLPYLQAVCNEVLRTNPPVTLTIREAANDATIQGHFVPAGTRIILAPESTNMSVALWGEDADKFNPDRWLGEGRAKSGGATSNYAFMTFLHGPRSCIGQAFAKAEFACLVAAIVGRFEMELENLDGAIERQDGITSKPKGGLPVRMRALEGW